MNHSFDVDLAKEYGLDESIMINHFLFWIQKNEANRKNHFDDRTWTYNSITAFTEIFPYWSVKQIRRILTSLIDQEVILTGNYNEAGYDRTMWYAFVDESIFLNGQTHLSKRANQFVQTGKPIPDTLPVNKPYSRGNRFSPPTPDEIKKYCKESGNEVDAERFVDFYSSKGWMVGKNKMKDWRAAVRTWSKGQKKKEGNAYGY